MPKHYPKLSEDFVEKKEVSTGEVVTADHANSKRYFIKDERPTDDEGFIGDVCFVFNLEPPEPPEPEVLPPFELITGYTIDHVGTSASLVGGQVEFEGVTSLSLNGVFSSEYRNYVVSYRGTSTVAPSLESRLRASGTDASGSSYTYQRLLASSATIAGVRTPSTNLMRFGESQNGNENGHTVFVYGPFLAQPTAVRSVTMHAESGARISDYAGTHSLSTSYDGITVFPNLGSITGALQVYGVRS